MQEENEALDIVGEQLKKIRPRIMKNIVELFFVFHARQVLFCNMEGLAWGLEDKRTKREVLEYCQTRFKIGKRAAQDYFNTLALIKAIPTASASQLGVSLKALNENSQ